MTRFQFRSVLLAGSVVLAFAVAGCNRDKAEAPAAPAPAPTAVVTRAEAAAPFDFDSKTPYAEVELKLPQAVKGQPDLHARLYAGAVRDLRQFSEGSQADRTEAGGDMGLGAYEKTITFDMPLETGKLFSLARSNYEFTGGAHGMTSYGGVIWDKALRRVIEGPALFRKGANLAALDSALCAAVNAEKKRRDPQATPVTLGGTDGWSCPRAASVPFVLAAGSVPGKAGGLTFLVGPYQVGPYSDGSYWVNVPQSAIRALIDPAYVDEFAGDPTPLPTPQAG